MTTNTKRDIKQQYERDLQLIQQLSDNEQVKRYQDKVEQLEMLIDRLSCDLVIANKHAKNAYNELMTHQRSFCLDTPPCEELRKQYDAAVYKAALDTVSIIQQTQSELKKMLKMLQELNVKECPVSQKYVIVDWTFRLFNNELPRDEYLELSKHIHGSPNLYVRALWIPLITLTTLLCFATMITCMALFPPSGLPVVVMGASEIFGILTLALGVSAEFINHGMAKEIEEIDCRFRLFKPKHVQCNTSSTVSIPAQIWPETGIQML